VRNPIEVYEKGE
jgi:hypothetical protein